MIAAICRGGGDRTFLTWTGSVYGSLNLPAQFSLTLLGSWQYTPEKLLPGDQLFSIGGPTTVRGYQTNSAAGDSGYYFNVELHRNMSDLVRGLDVYAFIDSGSVFSVAPSSRQLDSSGVGFSWTPVAPLTLEASIGFPWRRIIANQDDYQLYARISFRPLLLIQPTSGG